MTLWDDSLFSLTGDDNTCDNCGKRVRFSRQIKVETVDGAQFMCSECAPEFQDDDDDEPGHPLGCVCADCAGAELTADND